MTANEQSPAGVEEWNERHVDPDERGCVITTSRITGDIICQECGTNCECLICAANQEDGRCPHD